MNILEFIKLAFFAITRNKMRAFLTMLGIIIGVGAVVSMIGIGEGSKQASLAIIQNMGVNMLTIRSTMRGGPGGGGGGAAAAAGTAELLKEEDALAIVEECSSTVMAASPYVTWGGQVVWQNYNTRTTVFGSNEDFETIRGWKVEDGRFFTDHEVRAQAKVCIVGKTVIDNLFMTEEDPIGQIIRIGKSPFEIIGVMELKGAGMFGDQDDAVIAPYTTVMRKLRGNSRLDSIVASAYDGKADLAEAEITAFLRQRMNLMPRDENSFRIGKQDDQIKQREQQANIIGQFLALGASISLIVGGIGISNIMLVSVTERTREIGIRRALGATQTSVMAQFLTEAVVLSLLGGLLGLVLSITAILIIRNFTQLPASMESWAMALGIGFSAIVGIIAGFLPALKAAKLDVIDALRYE